MYLQRISLKPVICMPEGRIAEARMGQSTYITTLDRKFGGGNVRHRARLRYLWQLLNQSLIDHRYVNLSNVLYSQS
jgi:hypothetical protein